MRQELTQLLNRMEGNDQLEQLLADVLANTEKATAVARAMDTKSALPS
jgi:predicted component of type VI protein secretion system